MKKMVTRKTWDEFRASGLLWFINTFLHAFGWAIVVGVDDETGKVNDSYPARVLFRGFPDDDVDEGYTRISKYMKENGAILLEEIKEDNPACGN